MQLKINISLKDFLKDLINRDSQNEIDCAIRINNISKADVDCLHKLIYLLTFCGDYHQDGLMIESEEKPCFLPYYDTPRNACLKFQTYFKFGFVRNPWDRMLSNWLMFSQQDFRRKQLYDLFKINVDDLDFETFIKMAFNIRNHHWENQTSYFANSFSEISQIDFVGKLESIVDDWETVKRSTGISVDLNKINSSSREKANYHLYYNDKTRVAVERMFNEDIENFVYHFK